VDRRQVSEILSRAGYATSIIALSLGQLCGLDDKWEAGWGRTDTELRAVTHQACLDQLHLAVTADASSMDHEPTGVA